MYSLFSQKVVFNVTARVLYHGKKKCNFHLKHAKKSEASGEASLCATLYGRKFEN
jgi:hypothetical protein